MKRFRVLLSAVAILFFCRSAPAQEQKDMTTQSVKLAVETLEGMRYPPLARTAHVEGRVIVRVKLDDAGYVRSAEALPDQDEKKAILTGEAISNARRWRFRTHRAREAEIIYDFVLADECPPEETEWRFAFRAPNAVEISDCATSVQLTAAEKQKASAAAGVVTFLSFEGMRYPPLAKTARIRGDVLVRAELDDEGKVVSASVVAGHPMLAQEAVYNIRKWRFQPNPEKEVSMVYSFRFGDNACPTGRLSNDFDFEPPNLVIIKACAYMVNP